MVRRGSDLKSCAITCASRRRAWATSASNWPSTTPSSSASAKRPSSTASDARSRVSGSSPSRHVTLVPSGRIVGSAGTASSSWSTRPIRLRNSKRRNISFSCERSGGCRTRSAGCMLELEVAAHRRELLRHARLLGVLLDVPATRRRQLVGVRDHLLERAVLRDQLSGGLVADARDAGDVVARVALEADEVGDLIRPDPVPRLDSLGRVHVHVRDAARRHHQRDVVGDELERVAVGRDDRRLDARFVRAGRERRDHVVGLPALELEVAVAERLDDRAEVRELLAQEVGRRLPLRLVRLERLEALDRAGVPGHRDALRPVVLEQLEEHVREAEQRVRREALRRRELLGQREEGAIGEVVAVDEEELGVPRGPVVELQLLAGERLRHPRRVYSRPRARPL